MLAWVDRLGVPRVRWVGVNVVPVVLAESRLPADGALPNLEAALGSYLLRCKRRVRLFDRRAAERYPRFDAVERSLPTTVSAPIHARTNGPAGRRSTRWARTRLRRRSSRATRR